MTKLLEYFDSLNKILDDQEINEIINNYNDWVKYQPSIIDGDSDVGRPHHLRTAGNSGTGIKPNDLWQVPITYNQHLKHHSTGKWQDLFLDRIPELHERFLDETCLFWLKGKIFLDKINTDCNLTPDKK